MEKTNPHPVSGKLYLIPTPLGNTDPREVLPDIIKDLIARIDHYIVENEKTARHFIKKVHPEKAQAALDIKTLNKYTDPASLPSYLKPCLQGFPVGVVSEAGCPGVADPGAEIVRIAHEKNIPVVPLAGPSSLIMALMASGMNGQCFAFNGYLPIPSEERRAAIKNLERISKEKAQSQLIIETPYRNPKLLAELLRTLHKTTRLCIACDITLPTEYIKTRAVQEWRKTFPELNKRPALFIIQA